MIFDDILEIKNGRNQKNVENPNGKYPIYGSGGIMGYADDYICEADTVIIGRKGSINNPIYVEEPFWNVDTAFGLSAKREILMPRYLYYFCQYFDFERLNKAVTIPSLTKSDLLKIELKLPTIETQKKIVDRLIKVEQIIQLKKRELQKLDTLVKSRFAEMFGDPIQNPYNWSIKSLLEMGYCKNGMNFHTGDSGIELYCLGVGDFKNYSIIDGTDQLSKISLNEMPPEESMLQNGDIVFVRSNGNKDLVGRCVLVYPHDVQTTYSGFCIRYRLTSREVNKNYLLRVLKTDSMRKQMTGRGANIQNLNQKTLATLNIPIPPIELQNQFADFVASIDKSKSKIQKSLQETQLLFDSLMQKYFG
ncbi:restriction endonuclease subunit S [Faecalicatena sp. BF-R-105]|nr:restriction endonuclease subunit S [Faecalicatena sp. BF-R-105]